MKYKMLTKAVGIALALSPAIALAGATVENVVYSGYGKWGTIFTDNDAHNNGKGERNDVIRADHGYGNFRLGNEMNWWEAAVKADVWKSGDAVFDTTLMLGSGDKWGDVSTIQFWSAGHNIFASQPNAKVWVGERFYRRHEVHMIDIKYWDTSSTGIGIEDWDLGFANAHFAWMAPNSSYTDETDATNDGGRTLHNIDVRLSDIVISDTADFTIGINYIFENNSDHGDKDVTTSGAMLSTLYRQAWQYGSNSFAFQYGTDGLAGGLMSAEGGTSRKYSTGLEHDGYSWRFFNSGDLNLSEDFQVMYSLAYQDKNLDNDYGDKWLSVAARPQYAWNEFMSTALEVGYENVEAQNGAGNNDLFKITLAQTFQAGKGTWARPSLRLFATWSDKGQEYERNGNKDYGEPVSVGSRNVEEFTFGFNMETWW
ncbi:maltoporin [Photobacterium sanctipauli]|uniref:Maltoporin n=1 Tax=Photobacterium sanctipauli TaxID=1342794 RepID=A0A2T3NYE5_9GAMM|nr:carbohydrate porin [Photobacterium sanctipauli]PSW21305.1 maltoporin [Photobacterium sanctipauli]